MSILNITEVTDQLDILVLHYHVQINADQMMQLAKDKQMRGFCYSPPAMIQAIINVVPVEDWGKDNPNTGRKTIDFRYGMENSRVLYVVICKNNWLHIPADDERWTKLLAKFAEIGSVHEADENYQVPPTDPYTITWRYWWD